MIRGTAPTPGQQTSVYFQIKTDTFTGHSEITQLSFGQEPDAPQFTVLAYTAPTAELDVLDRVGGGDGFAAGFIYGLLSGEAPESALKLGWAHGALLTTFPGDTTMATVEQVRAFAKGGSARIQR